MCVQGQHVKNNKGMSLGSLYFVFSGCVQGQRLYGGQCMYCGLGTYQESPFHTEDMCKNCSGTGIKFQTFSKVGLSMKLRSFNVVQEHEPSVP